MGYDRGEAGNFREKRNAVRERKIEREGNGGGGRSVWLGIYEKKVCTKGARELNWGEKKCCEVGGKREAPKENSSRKGGR